MTSATRTRTARTAPAKGRTTKAQTAKAQPAKAQTARTRTAKTQAAKRQPAKSGAAPSQRAKGQTAKTGADASPRSLTLKGRKAVQLRPMAYTDADALHRFFGTIPQEDLLFLRRDVTDRDVIESWAQDVAADDTLTLLAERDGKIVGEASIHRSRVPWTAHVGEIRVVVDADHRTAGLGTALVQAIFLEALGRGVEKIIAEMTPDQKGAITLFQKLGFRVEGLFRDHVRDRRGRKRDLVVMAHEVHEANNQLAQWGITDAVERSR